MPEGRRGSVIFSPSVPAPKPAGLIDAISEIQQYYIIEKTGQDIPPEFLTIRGVMTFFGVGFKNGFIEGLILGTFLPVAWGYGKIRSLCLELLNMTCLQSYLYSCWVLE